jgi:hypothetical protein
MGIGIGDVTTVFAILAALGIVFPGLLLAWSLLLPGTVERARERVTQTPGRTFLLGGLVLLVAGTPAVLLTTAAGPLQFMGFVGVFLLMAVASIGAGGVAALMGERLRGQGIQASSPGALVRGGVALEFAVIFPLVGWFILFPIVVIISLGAACFALVHWSPRVQRVADTRLSMSGPQVALGNPPSAIG